MSCCSLLSVGYLSEASLDFSLRAMNKLQSVQVFNFLTLYYVKLFNFIKFKDVSQVFEMLRD